jgi:hypothetical protein
MADRPFLSRWSRLKQEARNQPPGQTGGGQQAVRRGGAAPVLEESVQQAALPPEAEDRGQGVPARQPARQPERQPERARDTEIDPSDLPDIDSLTAESDFTAFMRKGVPKTLQRKALRKLWTSDPVLACLDGLNDYEEDFTDAATVIEGMKSSYQVGRGFLTDAELTENDAVYRASREARIVAEDAEMPADGPVEAAMPTESDAAQPDTAAPGEALEEDERTEAARLPETSLPEDDVSPEAESAERPSNGGTDNHS